MGDEWKWDELSDYFIDRDDRTEYWNDTPQANNIILNGGGQEMLRVAPEGFYVRGVRVEADAKEAENVYKAFKQWMTWAIMNGQILDK